MSAGRFKHAVVLIKKSKGQSSSGFVKQEDVVLCSRRANIVKQMQSYDKDGLMAREVFYGETLLLELRTEESVKEATEIVYEEEKYAIIMKRPNRRNTILTCKKIDK